MGALLGVVVGSIAVHLEGLYLHNLYDLTGYSDATFPLLIRVVLCTGGVVILAVDSKRKSKWF